jgi:hypothetical protein
MTKINYDLRYRRKTIEQKASLHEIHSTLDSLGNNLMGMLWMMHLSLAALEDTPNLDQAKNNLKDALRAGNCAKKMMRLILDSWKPIPG